MYKVFLLLFVFLIPFKINALNLGKSAILMEEDTKRILVSKNINDKRLIASTTKIMTAVIALESNKLDKYITVSDKVLEAYGSSIYLHIGEKIKIEDLIYGLMLRSGNDAALMIEENLGGHNEFIKKMNDKAKLIGMKNTIFKNSHGLDEKEENKSTAYDMALLMRYANSIDKFKEIVKTKKRVVKTNKNTHIWYNKNKLLFSYKYTTGGKTGFTDKARRTLVTSASKDNLNLIVVTLNDNNDFYNHKKLYEYGFNNYKMKKVFDKNKFNKKNKKVYVLDDYFYPITEKEKDLIVTKYDKKENKVIISLGGKIIHKEKVYIRKKHIKKDKKNILNYIKNILHR